MLNLKLTQEEEEELEKRIQNSKRTNSLIYIDLKVIEFSHHGKTVKEIAKLLSLHPQTVRTIIHKFKDGRFEGLTRKTRGKPEKKLKAYDKDYWEDVLSRPPSHFEKLETDVQNWSYALLQRYIKLYLDITCTLSTIWNHLRNIGYTSGRAKLSITSPDPEYQVKRKRLETLKEKAVDGSLSQADSLSYQPQPGQEPKPAVVMMMDETDIHLCPDLKTKTLKPKGEQVKVQGPGQDEVCYLFGSTNPFTGEGLYEIYNHKTSCQYAFHLEHLLDLFPDSFIFLIADNAPSHLSKATLEFLEKHKHQIEFVSLPTYSPNLNGIERLWKLMRDDLTRNVVYSSLSDKCQTIMNYFQNLSFEQFISIMGCTS